ncbi:ATP-binding protein [Kamptonema animale CS-326]|jgi:AAA+ ATPase superfamily predicted ATPase|uniref:ATP-binding protein n=1 Tax=Kamptonema animale TaxID=92934 RepID=UPI00232BBAEE|nr:ATP-binding protein [Kamptonema animale]MDB9511554.1 ATP-binding protein [Kamptonema animale CS-326]
MSQPQTTVPRLDLAPKLRRPLSLLNPLDYLQLLYWSLFFPQALRVYVDTFGNKFIPTGKVTWRKALGWLRHSTIERQLLLQGLALAIFTVLILGKILELRGVPLDWYNLLMFPVILYVIVGLVSAWVIYEKYGLKRGVASWVASGLGFIIITFVVSRTLGNIMVVVAVSVASSWASFPGNDTMTILAQAHLAQIVFFGLLFGISFGVSFGVTIGVVSGVALSVFYFPFFGICFGMLVSLGSFISFNFTLLSSLVTGIGFGLAFALMSCLAIIRLENWLFGLSLMLLTPNNQYWYIPHVTPLPIPNICSQLKNWLRHDWEIGLHNANQILAYTLQFQPVIQAINQVLSELPSEQVIFRVAQLANSSYDQRLLRFGSEKLRLGVDSYVFELRLDTEPRAAAAGFWYLYSGLPDKAAEAFTEIRSLLYGEEMLLLSQTLAHFYEAEDLAAIAFLKTLNIPEEPLFSPASWEAIACLYRVVHDARVVQRSLSSATRSFYLNRGLEDLNNLLDKISILPQSEKGLIIYIAHNWKAALWKVTSKLEKNSITEPVPNPYIIGDPVEGNLFVGRDDVLRLLKELWVLGYHFQSVVIYCHRRMGKTSILLNISEHLGAGVKVAYINLLLLVDIPLGVGEVLIAISDAIYKEVNVTPPNDEDLLNLPYRTFERYLQDVNSQIGEKGLIIALDEFEQIETLIINGKIPPNFMGFLRGLVQMSPKIAFAFAGLHTLEEMTADYFQPFFASVIPIRVSFLTPEATHQLLINPAKGFPLGYTLEVVDQIYLLTHGQPYLVQLIGFLLVRRYNDLVFEMGKTLDPVFTRDDVEAVINDPDFFIKGRYYFTGVWGQSAQGARGQQEILKILAPHPEGINLEAIIHATNIDETTLNEAIETLKRHDVIQETNQQYQIIVELFRRWVLENKRADRLL